MPNEQFQLPDGLIVGTGLKIPVSRSSNLPAYSTTGPMLSRDDIIQAAKSGNYRGRDRFDRTFIKNQRNHGSCNGFAEAAALTRARIRRLGMKYRVDLSGAYAYSLINGGRDNGSMLDDGMSAAMMRGVCREEYCDWNQIYPTMYDKGKCDADAAKHKAFECYSVSTEVELFSGLVSGFDAVVAVHAGNNFMNMDSKGIAGGDNGAGNHAVMCDGCWYDQSTDTLMGDGVNSWGWNYGIEGRMGLTWARHFRQPIQYHSFYLMRSTEDSPEGEQPPVAAI